VSFWCLVLLCSYESRVCEKKFDADFVIRSFFVLQEGLIVNIKPRDGDTEEQQANGGAEKEDNGY
jgi:hypothetical protein